MPALTSADLNELGTLLEDGDRGGFYYRIPGTEFRRIPGTVYLINRLPLEHRSCRVSHGLSFPAIRIM